MKRHITLLSIALSFNLTINSQVGVQTISEYIPESASVTDIGTYNPDFNNCFIFNMAHGLTAFNQKNEIFLIDSKTFQEKKKIEFPKYKGYSRFSLRTNHYIDYFTSNILDLNQNLVLIYSNKVNKKYAISAVKLKESLDIPESPQYLFTADDEYNVKFFKNTKKDICIFSYTTENKKANKKCFHYYVYNNELNLLKSDSIEFAFDSKDVYYTSVYNSGFAITKENGLNYTLSITDIKTNKTNTIDLSNGTNNFIVAQIQSVQNDKIVVCGSYYSVYDKNKVNNGLFKINFNQKTGQIEDKINYDIIPSGKFLREEEHRIKNIENICITEKGECYMLISQTFNEWDGSIASQHTHKYEMVYINTNASKWKKQLPIVEKTSDKIEMIYSNGYLLLSYLDYEGDKNTIDFNNYAFGNPFPSNPVTLRQTYESNVSLLKINSEGKIQHQSFNNIFYKSIMNGNKEFIGITQGLNGQVTSKCKFLRLELNDK